MIINHNIAALNTHRQLSSASSAQSNSMEKLSSGLRINKAGDDAAGLAISEKMRGQIRGLDMSSKNAQDANSLIATAEGALNETHDILQRMRELAVQAGNDTNTTTDREEIQKEINQMTSEINRIGNTTEFNTQKLLNGSKDVAVEAKGAVEAKDAIAGVYTITEPTADIEIDGKTFNYAAEDPEDGQFTTGEQLVALIEADEDLSAKYTATIEAGNLKLTQKEGHESATAPTGATFTEATKGSAAVAAKDAVEAGKSLNFQIGANENQSLTLNISDMRAKALGLSTEGTADAKRAVTDGTSSTTSEQALSVLTHEAAAATVTTIQSAIDQVSAERSKLGATQNRLDHTINNLNTSSENLTAAESRIRDVDMAKEMMEQTKNSILSQAAQAMLAQSNQMPQGVLQLLR